MVRASQARCKTLDTLVKRLDNILTFIQSGQGSIGKVIYDPQLFDRANAMLIQLQQIVAQAQHSTNGSIGKLLNSDELYNKADLAVDNLNKTIDQINSGNGTIGKFIKDPALYDNANQTMAERPIN